MRPPVETEQPDRLLSGVVEDQPDRVGTSGADGQGLGDRIGQLGHGCSFASAWDPLAFLTLETRRGPWQSQVRRRLSLRVWVNRAEIDSGRRPGTSTVDTQRIAPLEREVKWLRRANDILKAASVFFATELDGRPWR